MDGAVYGSILKFTQQREPTVPWQNRKTEEGNKKKPQLIVTIFCGVLTVIYIEKSVWMRNDANVNLAPKISILAIFKNFIYEACLSYWMGGDTTHATE